MLGTSYICPFHVMQMLFIHPRRESCTWMILLDHLCPVSASVAAACLILSDAVIWCDHVPTLCSYLSSLYHKH